MKSEVGVAGRVNTGNRRADCTVVEGYARSGAAGATGASAASLEPASPEKLYSPEEAADYLGIHVQTVRGWIRSGRLKASRLTGQRALRIAASDLRSVLEPVEPGEFTD